MLFELRQYRAKPGKRDALVALMEDELIPFQISKGMSIVASFIAEEEDDLYVWIRRFESEEHRIEMYAAVYETDEWKNDFSPRIPDLIDRDKNHVTRLIPTAVSPLH